LIDTQQQVFFLFRENWLNSLNEESIESIVQFLNEKLCVIIDQDFGQLPRC
jgi:hypothetical protein